MSDSKGRLAMALRVRGFTTLGRNAEQGFYDDFESPMALPKNTLVADLQREARDKPFLRANAHDMIVRVEDGEFDNTAEEAEQWVTSCCG